MGVNMLCTVLFFVIANFVIAYLAGQVIAPGADKMKVFQFVGTAGILTYGTANILNGIWFGRKMVADIIDGVVFGLITGDFCRAMAGGHVERTRLSGGELVCKHRDCDHLLTSATTRQGVAAATGDFHRQRDDREVVRRKLG